MDLGQCEVNSPHKKCKNVENERCVPAWVCAEVAKMTFLIVLINAAQIVPKHRD